MATKAELEAQIVELKAQLEKDHKKYWRIIKKRHEIIKENNREIYRLRQIANEHAESANELMTKHLCNIMTRHDQGKKKTENAKKSNADMLKIYRECRINGLSIIESRKTANLKGYGYRQLKRVLRDDLLPKYIQKQIERLNR